MENDEFVEAAKEGDLSRLRELLRQDIGVNKESALRGAAENGRLEVVRYLVEQCSARVETEIVISHKPMVFASYRPLVRAAESGNAQVVRYLAALCGEVGEKEEALREAAKGGHLDEVQCLAEEFGADVNSRSQCDGHTPLLWAAEGGHIDVVRYLVDQRGVDANVRGWGQSTLLMEAAKRGHIGVVQYLTEHCGADVNAKERSGFTALMGAAGNGHIEIMRYLVEQYGADVNAKSVYGSTGTVLMEAARHGHIQVVQYLVGERGADVNGKDQYGVTALMEAVESGNVELVQYLTECGAEVEGTVMPAIRSGKIEVVRHLVEECGAKYCDTTKDKQGYTALTLAARNGYTEILRYLVEQCNADVNAKRDHGLTALMEAALLGRTEIVRFLAKQCGADVAAVDEGGSTALLRASLFNKTDVVRVLATECNADVDARDKDGNTALMHGIGLCKIEFIRCVVEECGADVNAKNTKGRTALMAAAERGDHYIKIVQYFAENCGADANAVDANGYTALMLSAQRDQLEVVRYLAEQCGADVNIKAKDGNTAIRIAANRGLLEIQRALTPFLLPIGRLYTRGAAQNIGNMEDLPLIPPPEVELTTYCRDGHIGGDFRAKWLGADAVVKLFIPDASHLPFGNEVRLWQGLRHPNVLKMYGACDAGPNLQFFVCEYASEGSLVQHVTKQPEGKPTLWKYLFEAALGLEYLHERGIVHGDLRCSNILIGSDGVAKLSNFGLSGSTKRSDPISSCAAVVNSWKSPEVLTGEQSSYESDVYSLGLCVVEAVIGKKPLRKNAFDRIDYEHWDPKTGVDLRFDSYDLRELVRRMCCRGPQERASLSSVVYKLERLATEEAYSPQSGDNPSVSIDEYEYGTIKSTWSNVEQFVQKCENAQYGGVFADLTTIRGRLQESAQHPSLFARFHVLLTEFYRTIKTSPEQARLLRLSSTRATSNSLYALQWRINSLLASLGEATDTTTQRETRWQEQRSDQIELFASGVSDSFLLLKDLTSAEERAAFLKTLKAEIESPVGKYTCEQLELMQNAYKDITSSLGADAKPELTPQWFIPWYELIVDEWSCLGEGGFGSVHRAKWLDSDVVVKRVTLDSSNTKTDASSSWSSLSAAILSCTGSQSDTTKRAEAQAMFRREVDIWFGFSHPHVIELFGACHVGRPFFVCEYATNGTLVSYLREHPDELWSKLHEAALGVQYLHARGVVHGDLKGNNIVIGNDRKAKVTDFGLSLATHSDEKPTISGAWHWVAPECLAHADKRPTLASDVYSLGMCVVEALRVVESVRSGKGSRHCLPWRVADNNVVKYHATRGTLPSRPAICSDSEWELVKQMCALQPEQRMKISTVVDKLRRLTGAKRTTELVDTPPPLDTEAWVSTSERIATAYQGLQYDDSTRQASVIALFISFWKRVERVHAQLGDDQNKECRIVFCSLVTEAEAITAMLHDRKESLVWLAQTTMRCYALDRELTKFCEAFFLTPSGPVLN